MMLDWQDALLAITPGNSLGYQPGLVLRKLVVLAEKGLVREKYEGRSILVHLTPAGETLAASLRGHECTDECDEMADTERAER